mmetsp:Transcript_8577/g.18662  ORF Transcript_8577/g.18662 Transcript_8577/m.18662 type:complete len:97 (-) Transcript_8577:277-567(-)
MMALLIQSIQNSTATMQANDLNSSIPYWPTSNRMGRVSFPRVDSCRNAINVTRDSIADIPVNANAVLSACDRKSAGVPVERAVMHIIEVRKRMRYR